MQIKDGQKLALIKLCQRFVKGREARLWVLSQLLDKKVTTTEELFVTDWQKIRDEAYPNWPNDDWEISEGFANKVNELKYRYEREVLGQLALFD